MRKTQERGLLMPANYTAVDSKEAASLEGGSFLLTALGIYGAYAAYTNFLDYVKNNTQKVQEFQSSLASGFSSFLNVFEKLAVLKVGYDILKWIF